MKGIRIAHPWIFNKLVQKPEGRIPPGSVVDVGFTRLLTPAELEQLA